MSTVLGPGDRVRVLRNTVHAHKKDGDYLVAGDIIAVEQIIMPSSVRYYYPETSADGKVLYTWNTIPCEDVELVEKFPGKSGDRVRVIRNGVSAHAARDKFLEVGDIITIGMVQFPDIFYEYPFDQGNGNHIMKTNSIPIGNVELLRSEQEYSYSMVEQEPECRCDNKYILYGTHQPGCAYKAWRDAKFQPGVFQ